MSKLMKMFFNLNTLKDAAVTFLLSVFLLVTLHFLFKADPNITVAAALAAPFFMALGTTFVTLWLGNSETEILLAGFSRKQFANSRFAILLTATTYFSLLTVTAHLVLLPDLIYFCLSFVLLLFLKDVLLIPFALLVKRNSVWQFVVVVFSMVMLLMIYFVIFALNVDAELQDFLTSPAMKKFALILAVLFTLAAPISIITTQKAYAKKDI